jgi:geranylgeranyl pyrophosphate synthase
LLSCEVRRMVDFDSIVALIRSVWESDKQLIDRRLEELVEDLPEVYAVEASKYIVEGGKRFRGFLTLEVARCLGGSVERALDAAAAVELIHSSSLALDDIIDVDVVRRGRPSAWIEIGLRKTVMAVYLLVTYAHKIVERAYGARAVSLTIDATFNISRGEVIDSFMDLDATSPDVYEKLIDLKTASLFKLAAELGAISAGRVDLVEYAGDYGRRLGLIYQIADDVVDSMSGEDSPAIRLFRRWLGREDYEKAYKTIAFYIREAESLSSKLGCRGGLLEKIPIFIAYGMLRDRISNVLRYLA